MSEQVAASETSENEESTETVTAVAGPEPSGPLFEEGELEQFDEDDVEAGRAICKMLSLFFLYTVLAMAIVGIWTYSAAFGH